MTYIEIYRYDSNGINKFCISFNSDSPDVHHKLAGSFLLQVILEDSIVGRII